MNLSAEEIKIVEGLACVKEYDKKKHILRLDTEFRTRMFEAWKKEQSKDTIRRIMEAEGLGPEFVGNSYYACVEGNFRQNGRPSYKKSDIETWNGECSEIHEKDKLVLDGHFIRQGNGLALSPVLMERLRQSFPEISVEEGLRDAGVDPLDVGRIRIEKIERRLKEQAKKDIKQTVNERQLQATTAVPARSCLENPYVYGFKDGILVMHEAFYNEAVSLLPMGIDEILRIYEIEALTEAVGMAERVHSVLLRWEQTSVEIEDVTDQVIRIQSSRFAALKKIVEMNFGQIRQAVRRLSPSGKRTLCRQIADYPAANGHVYHYSLRQLLEKTGISKSTYYRALYDPGYGKAEERRKERDREDLEKVVSVMEYKGYVKGIRQIYMMLPDLTGEVFALSKIRRLLRQNGIKTKVRSENPARQRMGQFMERNRKPNLLRREFRLHRPNEVRLMDVTYLDYGSGEEKKRAYGSSCIDPVTGKLLVFHLSGNNDLELALGTLEKLKDYPAVEGVLLHSDQGILYFTDEFQKKVQEMGMVQSMSKRGNCWDNAPQESFFGHFKDECGYGLCESFEQLIQMVDEYAWYYNNERRQWDRKRMTPVQYEAYLLSLTEEGYAEYMRTEREKYDRMKAKAEKQAIERAKTLGV